MRKQCILLVLAGLLATCTMAASSQSVILNGQKVSLAFIDQKGKPLGDIIALVKLLGGTATYDKTAKRLVITMPKATGGSSAPTTTTVVGTNELAGTWAKLDTVYTIGKEQPMYITLKSAEYTVARISIGDNIYAPTQDQKLLVLRFAVQNPNKVESLLHWATFRFTAIDDKNINYEYVQDLGDVTTHAKFSAELKPAQKTEVYTVIPVPATAVIPKIMIRAGTDENSPVLRYDPSKDVKPLSAPFADPKDPTGVIARSEVPAEMGTAYPYSYFDVTVEKAEFSDKTTILDNTLEDGQRFFIVTLSCKNQVPMEYGLFWASFTPKLTTTDGDDIHWNQTMLLGSTDRTADVKVKPGESARVRYFYMVDKDITLKSFSLYEGENGRVYTYDLSKGK